MNKKIWYINYDLGTVYPIKVRLPSKQEKKYRFHHWRVNDANTAINIDFVALESEKCKGGTIKGEFLSFQAKHISKDKNGAISTLIHELMKEQERIINKLRRATSLIL